MIPLRGISERVIGLSRWSGWRVHMTISYALTNIMLGEVAILNLSGFGGKRNRRAAQSAARPERPVGAR
jgi:hypothetical protein